MVAMGLAVMAMILAMAAIVVAMAMLLTGGMVGCVLVTPPVCERHAGEQSEDQCCRDRRQKAASRCVGVTQGNSSSIADW